MKVTVSVNVENDTRMAEKHYVLFITSFVDSIIIFFKQILQYRIAYFEIPLFFRSLQKHFKYTSGILTFCLLKRWETVRLRYWTYFIQAICH